jgi:hypothetical protein
VWAQATAPCSATTAPTVIRRLLLLLLLLLLMLMLISIVIVMHEHVASARSFSCHAMACIAGAFNQACTASSEAPSLTSFFGNRVYGVNLWFSDSNCQIPLNQGSAQIVITRCRCCCRCCWPPLSRLSPHNDVG